MEKRKSTGQSRQFLAERPPFQAPNSKAFPPVCSRLPRAGRSPYGTPPRLRRGEIPRRSGGGRYHCALLCFSNPLPPPTIPLPGEMVRRRGWVRKPPRMVRESACLTSSRACRGSKKCKQTAEIRYREGAGERVETTPRQPRWLSA